MLDARIHVDPKPFSAWGVWKRTLPPEEDDQGVSANKGKIPNLVANENAVVLNNGIVETQASETSGNTDKCHYARH